MTKKVLIGSAAAHFWYPTYRKPHDLDYLEEGIVEPYLKSNTNPREEYYPVEGEGLKYIYDYAYFEGPRYIATQSQLYALKMSHCFWNINWAKTMSDIAFFQNEGVYFNEDLFNMLYETWEKIHGNKRAKLKGVSNEEFFTSTVNRKFRHDDLHERLAYSARPMYERCKPNLDEAYISKKMFNNMDWEDRIKMAREEIWVTALERFLIPSNFKEPVAAAYWKACKLLLTSMTKGFFATFIALNWLILRRPDKTRVELEERIQGLRPLGVI